MTALWLVRHAESTLGAVGRTAGQSDVDLSPLGVEQASRTAGRLAAEPIRAVLTSPMLRAVRTAAAIGEPHGLTPVPIDGLREMHQGEVDGLPLAELNSRYGDVMRRWREDPATTRLPGGETLGEVRDRAVAAVQAIIADYPDGDIVIVGHAFVNGVIVCWLLGLPLTHFRRLRFDAAGISRIAFRQGEPWITLLNGTDHLAS